MLRGLIFLILIGGAVLFTLPIVVSSVYVDQRGITIPGTVYSKREDVTVHNSTWTRSCEIMVQYSPPESGSIAFLNAELPPEQYDGYRKGQTVSLHYLPKKDIPDLPLAHVLSEVHVLTTARLADRRAFSAWEAFWTPAARMIAAFLGGMLVLLIVWRKSGFPGFAYGVFGCVLVLLAVVMISEFPTPAPAPAVAVRRTTGTVKSVDRITRLFAGKRTRGALAAQPIAVVGVEFVPEGRAAPVLAIDAIDAGSVAGLQKGSVVRIDYESQSPRTGYIQGATRDFVGRNLRGIAQDGVLCLLLLAGLFALWQGLGWAWGRLVARRS